jgi:hypothetical protein
VGVGVQVGVGGWGCEWGDAGDGGGAGGWMRVGVAAQVGKMRVGVGVQTGAEAARQRKPGSASTPAARRRAVRLPAGPSESSSCSAAATATADRLRAAPGRGAARLGRASRRQSEAGRARSETLTVESARLAAGSGRDPVPGSSHGGLCGVVCPAEEVEGRTK